VHFDGALLPSKGKPSYKPRMAGYRERVWSYGDKRRRKKKFEDATTPELAS